MALKKLSLTDEEVELLREFLARKMKKKDIATTLARSRSTVWRNMVKMGINKSYNQSNPQKTNKDCFNWDDFPDKSVI